MAGNGLKLVSALTKNWTETNCFNRVLSKVKIVSAGEGKCRAELTVGKEHQNPRGSLHGGYIATLVDVVSYCALLTHGNTVRNGVSTNINIRYLRAAKEGDEIVIDATTVKAGRNLAFLEVELKKKDTDALIAAGSHTVFLDS